MTFPDTRLPRQLLRPLSPRKSLLAVVRLTRTMRTAGTLGCSHAYLGFTGAMLNDGAESYLLAISTLFGLASRLQSPRESRSCNFFFLRRFAAALLPRLFGTNPRLHHKGATGRVRTGYQRLPVLCHCQLGQDIAHSG